ncbi:hypothetical protein PULV_a2571 [Pseudoalteromonas ulvae UL12]|uniref:Alkyl hydroperoxide reductase n=1 Tax=Pseudoalteromonas ulvae TaxID=107327 RepID=A0A244CP76_PSEDV|nr:peroxiredoxin-like family protein [Pseudoalteromonas ulvae]MBE0364278.1 hypothetical protein [Pseudoalteromonas ulvae UL12]OUL57404.1 alkyl hydroperoxide reductase [Pseudoalteromonas ulvae]
MKYIYLAILMFISPLTLSAEAFNIKASAEQVSPLLPGLTVPNSQVLNPQGKALSTDSLFAKKPTVLVVYRGGWCPFCSRQLMGLQQITSKLEALGLQVVAISPEKPSVLKTSKLGAGYQLLSDIDLSFSQKMGLAFYLEDKTAQIYRDKLGVNFVGIDGKTQVALPVPAVFLIDTRAMVHFQYTNPNYKVRLSNDVLLSAAQQMIKDTQAL